MTLDDDTRGDIGSNARHAITEIESLLANLEDPATMWYALHAALTRLRHIAALLAEVGFPPPYS